MSRINSAVVEGSSVTSLSSGFGGAFTVSQSLRMSLATVGAATNIMSTAATAARLRHELRITRIVLSFRLETAEV
jgi:hypothetical protein